MARPLSEEKRNALLQAATQVVAKQGLSAPTSAIAKVAGVAEGTLFTYFNNKDELLNQLYLQLKTEVAKALMVNYPYGEIASTRAHHVWTAYVYWAMDHPIQRAAMAQLSVSSRISPEIRQRAMEPLAEVEILLKECLGTVFGEGPEFAAALMSSMAETTVDSMTRHMVDKQRYAEAGFKAFWRAVNGT